MLCPEGAHRAGGPATDRIPQQTRRLLELDTSPRGQLLTQILTDLMAEASGMVTMCDDPPTCDRSPTPFEWIDRPTS